MIKERKWLVDLAGGCSSISGSIPGQRESRCVRVVIFRQKRSEKGRISACIISGEIFLGKAEA